MLGEHWARAGRFRVPWAFPSGKPKAAGRGLMRPRTLRRATADWRPAVAIHQPLPSSVFAGSEALLARGQEHARKV